MRIEAMAEGWWARARGGRVLHVFVEHGRTLCGKSLYPSGVWGDRRKYLPCKKCERYLWLGPLPERER